MDINQANIIDSVVVSYLDFVIYSGVEGIPYEQDIKDYINNQITIPVNIPNFIVAPAGDIHLISANDLIKSIWDYYHLAYIQDDTGVVKNSPITEVW